MGQDPTCSLQNKTRGLDHRSGSQVWIVRSGSVWIAGLDRGSGIACGFWGLIRTLNFEVQPYLNLNFIICFMDCLLQRWDGLLAFSSCGSVIWDDDRPSAFTLQPKAQLSNDHHQDVCAPGLALQHRKDVC